MIKKILLGAVLVLGLSIPTQHVFAKNVGKVNSNLANLISAPTASSTVLKKLTDGQAVEIMGAKDNFFKINVGGVEAYAQKKFIDIINIDGIVNADNVNIRILPYEDAQVISVAHAGDKLNINAVTGNWFVISHNNIKAYIAKKFVVAENLEYLQKIESPDFKVAVITSDNGLNMRKDKSVNSTAVRSIPANEVVDVIDDKDASDWTKVYFENEVGYVNSNYIKVLSQDTKNDSNKKSSKAAQIINYAKQFIGTPYQWSGRDLNKGVDCSGFVYCVMKNFGINLNNSSKTQVQNGIAVDNRNNLLPGDLVFFSNYGGSDIQHVGIYIGNGQFIHSASTNNKGVMISSLNENYYATNYITGRRVL